MPSLHRALVLIGKPILQLPPRLAHYATRRRALCREGHTLDPQARWMLALDRRFGMARLHTLPPPVARARFAASLTLTDAPPPPVAAVRHLQIPGPAGPMAARLYDPTGDPGPGPALLYLHGGGFVVGDLDTHDSPCRTLARSAGLRVVALDYRLAPEHPFPAALEDTLAAFRWLVAHGTEHGVDPERLAIGGDSAGGNLSAAASLVLRDAGGPIPAHQLLIYPSTDPHGTHASREVHGSGLLLTHELERWFLNHYAAGVDPDNPRLSPLRAAGHQGLPPATVAIAGFDLLRDEGLAYARALSEAGVPTEVLHFYDQLHGFIQFTGAIETAARALEQIGAALGRGMTP